MTCSSNPPDELNRIPGLYRRWELPEVLQPLHSYRIEEAGADADGTPLLAIYSGSLGDAIPSPAPTAGNHAEVRVTSAPPPSGPPPSPSRPKAALEDGHVLGQRELAQRWNISERSLERWRSMKMGPSYYKIGSKVRYSISTVEDFEHHGRIETRGFIVKKDKEGSS